MSLSRWKTWQRVNERLQQRYFWTMGHGRKYVGSDKSEAWKFETGNNQNKPAATNPSFRRGLRVFLHIVCILSLCTQKVVSDWEQQRERRSPPSSNAPPKIRLLNALGPKSPYRLTHTHTQGTLTQTHTDVDSQGCSDSAARVFPVTVTHTLTQ